MKKFLVLIPACTALLLATVSCMKSNSPVIRYTLSSALPATAEQPECVPAIKFSRISVPAYIDNSQIVTRDGQNTVLVSETRRWAEPLANAVQRLIPLQVAQLSQGKKLRDFENISVYIDRLDGPLQSGDVQISAQVIISHIQNAELRNESFIFSKSLPLSPATSNQVNGLYAAYACTLSQAIFELSFAIAEALEDPASAQ